MPLPADQAARCQCVYGSHNFAAALYGNQDIISGVHAVQFKHNIREHAVNKRLKLSDSGLERRDEQVEQQAQYLVSWEDVTMLQAHVSAAERAGYEVASSGLCRMQNQFRPVLRRSCEQIWSASSG